MSSPSTLPSPERFDRTHALAIPIKELKESDRSLLLSHLLSLGSDDRYLRFGNPVSDATIRGYVEGIDFATSTVFGAFDENLVLVAAGHFARVAPVTNDHGGHSEAAEFGLSVGDGARGRGMGTALFVRAANHARNLGIAMLFMHCLTQNKSMMRIARKAGMQISYDSGEADAFVVLAPSDAASVLQEAVQQQIAVFDYAYKRHVLGVRRLLPRLARAA